MLTKEESSMVRAAKAVDCTSIAGVFKYVSLEMAVLLVHPANIASEANRRYWTMVSEFSVQTMILVNYIKNSANKRRIPTCVAENEMRQRGTPQREYASCRPIATVGRGWGCGFCKYYDMNLRNILLERVKLAEKPSLLSTKFSRKSLEMPPRFLLFYWPYSLHYSLIPRFRKVISLPWKQLLDWSKLYNSNILITPNVIVRSAGRLYISNVH